MKARCLSERIVDGAHFAAANLCRHRRNGGTDRSEMASRCNARVVAQMKRHTYAFLFSPEGSWMVKKPVWSTPTVVKGVCRCTLSLGSGGGSGFGTVLPLTLQQVTHLKRQGFTRVGYEFLVSRFAVYTATRFGTLHNGYCSHECDWRGDLPILIY